MAVSAGQHQTPRAMQMVEQAINIASAPELLAYVDALKTRKAARVAGSWVNGALQPLLDKLLLDPNNLTDPAMGWSADEQRRLLVLAAQAWFGLGGPHQWKPTGTPTKRFEDATAEQLITIAEHRRTTGKMRPISIDIACRSQADIDSEPNKAQRDAFTITVPYSIFTLAQMDPLQVTGKAIGSAGDEMDLSQFVLSGKTVRADRPAVGRTSIPWDPSDPTALLDDIQGNILAAHGRKAIHLVFLRFDEGGADWAKEVGRKVTSALAQATGAASAGRGAAGRKPLVGLYLSAQGVTAVGTPVSFPDKVDPRLAEGSPLEFFPAAAGAGRHPAQAAHALVLVAADSARAAREKAMELVGSGGVTMLGEESGQRRAGDKEPFGFKDGISDPAMMLTSALRRMKGKAPVRWPVVFPKEQVLTAVEFPDGKQSAASYLVYTKFHQDVAAFNGSGSKQEQTRRIGRRRDGRLIDSATTTGRGPNDFDDKDLDRSGCPLSAHIRATNPRTAAGRSWTIARRGMPYAEEGSEGLHFMAFMASIENQFDRMIQNAVTEGDQLLTGTDGKGNRFVTPLDGGYFVAMPKSFFGEP